jgi:hypothetical protein
MVNEGLESETECHGENSIADDIMRKERCGSRVVKK